MRGYIINGLVILTLLSGCATTGTTAIANENQQTVEQKIKVGKTTKTEIKTMYGEPTNVATGNGFENWTYSFSQSKTDPKMYIPLVGIFMAKDSIKANTLYVSFDKKGVVNDYRFSAQNNSITRY